MAETVQIVLDWIDARSLWQLAAVAGFTLAAIFLWRRPGKPAGRLPP